MKIKKAELVNPLMELKFFAKTRKQSGQQLCEKKKLQGKNKGCSHWGMDFRLNSTLSKHFIKKYFFG